MSLAPELDRIQKTVISNAQDERTTTMNNEHSDIYEKLAAPFAEGVVKWKPQSIKGNRALAIAYISSRDVQQRLDDVIGPENWKDTYRVLRCGSVVCRLSLRLNGEWVTKTDCGSQSQQDDLGDRLKAAFSDAFKRCAVKFAVGRFLYSLPLQWCEFDLKTRRFASEPTLPAWATQEGEADDAPEPAVTPQNGNRVSSGKELFRSLKQLENDLQKQGLCRAGELIEFAAQAGQRAGIGTFISKWDEHGVAIAREATRRFIACKKSTVSNGSSAS